MNTNHDNTQLLQSIRRILLCIFGLLLVKIGVEITGVGNTADGKLFGWLALCGGSAMLVLLLIRRVFFKH